MSSSEELLCLQDDEQHRFEQILHEHLHFLKEELNVRLLCNTQDDLGFVMQVEEITLTGIEYPARVEETKHKRKPLNRFGEFMKKKIFRKKGFLWQSQNSLQD